MPVAQLTIRLDSGLLQHQLRVLAPLLEKLPKRRARRFYRKLLRMLVLRTSSQHIRRGCVAAVGAGDFAFQLRVFGLDELIASALRAQKRQG